LALTYDRDDRNPKLKLGDAPALKAIGSVANTLRGAREEHGQDLHAVAQVLRIRYDYLEAIENGAFERLPGTTYAHGFLRTYAEFLGLDGDEMVERFKEEMHGTESKPELVFPEPVTEGRIPGGAIILISAVLLGLAYGGWFYLSSQGKSVADLIPPLPERLQAMLAGEAETALESASADEPAGSEQASEYTPPEAESGEPSVLADPAGALDEPAEEPTPDPGVVASAPKEGGATAAVAEAPAAAEPADFESDAATAAGSETETTDTTADSAPVAPSPEPEASTQERVAATEPVEPVTAAARPEPVGSEPAPTPSVDPPPDPADSVASPPPVPAAPAKVVTAEPALARRTAAITAPLVEQTVVIPAPPAAPQSMTSTDRSPRVYGESTEGTRIVLRALQDSWVQIRDRQDALLLTRVLRAGDTYFVPARDGLTLLTGNAGGLEIRVDGVPVPPIGPVGTVRRQIALDPVRLLSGAAAPR
jgi:cytoskeletal protein RodZ